MSAIPTSRNTARAVFQIRLRARIWRVSLDGRFYGDYRAKQWAIEGAEEKGRAIRATGRGVQIVLLSEDGAIESDHVLPAT